MNETTFPTSMLPEPRIVNLPDYPCQHRVLGVQLCRNVAGGPLLTLAIAECRRAADSVWEPCRDIVTCMRLADMTSDEHAAPINAKKWYGKRGRRCIVARQFRMPWSMATNHKGTR